MSIELITALLFLSMLILLACGLPIAFALGGTAVVFAYFLWGIPGFTLMVTTTISNMRTIILIALPLFIFMGAVLQYSGLAESLFNVMYAWIGGFNGGLAIGTVLICTMFAACTGITGAATVTMGLVALPSMLQRKYDKKLAMGCIMAGGALGPLIPPSALLIVYALLASESVGRLFAGGVVPGLMLSASFVIYILIRCRLQPHLGPALLPEEKATWRKKFVLLKATVLPLLLIVMVLGSIFSGFATPTEAAAVGAFGSLLCAAIYRRLSWTNLKKAIYQTTKLSCMVLWIVIGATIFTTIYNGSGGAELVRGIVSGLNVAPIVIIVIIQITWLILGCLIDEFGILLLCTPIYVPIIKALGFDAVWFGVLFIVNMEMAYLTPPYGFNLFYMKGVAPKGTKIAEIYRSALPFLPIQLLTLVLVIIFPEIILWLPNLIYGVRL